MDLKNAVAVCLIALCSATLVVLIARALDLQAASRLEPQLERIADELEALRRQGGVGAASSTPETEADGVIVYYFHGNQRCPTCNAIESQSRAAVHEEFADALKQGKLVWKVVNFERSSGAALAKSFDVQTSVVVLAKMKNGRMESHRRLDEVWGWVRKPPALAVHLAEEIRSMLADPSGKPAAGKTPANAPKPQETAPTKPGVSPAEEPAVPIVPPAAG